MRPSFLIISACLMVSCSKAPKFTETRLLPSGDELIHEEDWTGRQAWLNDSSPKHRLHIRWKSTGKTELIEDGGWQRLHDGQSYKLWKESGWAALALGSDFYWKSPNQTGPWSSYRFWSSDALYEYLRPIILAENSDAKEESTESGRRILLKAGEDYYDVRDRPNAGWNLPYEVSDISFAENRVSLRRRLVIPGLPETLIFRGALGHFGNWSFAAEETKQSINTEQSRAANLAPLGG